MSELALELIRKEKEEKTGKLDLGNCGLTDFPEELFELEWLEELNICNEYSDYEQQKWIKSLNKGGRNLINQPRLPEAFARFRHLKTLRIGGGFGENWIINDCSVLRELNSLIRLSLSSNQISDFSFLEHLTGLTSLSLNYNKIRDYSFLEHLTGLTSLSLSYNKIRDIRFLEHLTSLTSLDLSYNKISDISILEHLTGLISLFLSYNKISDYSFLGHLTGLTSLSLSYNQISDISILGHLTGLTSLNLSYNKISDISILEHLTSLTLLDLRSNEISDISILEHLTSLTSLDLRSNRMNNIRLKNLTSLTHIDLHSNQISDIRLENLTSLTSLDLRSNRMNNILLKNLTSLTRIDLHCNQINNIHLENLASLTSLDLHERNISNIRLEKLTTLTSLDLSSNQISDIHFLEHLTGLTSLNLNSNKISDIHFLEHLTSLIRLDLNNNQISDISILEHLTGLISLGLGYNKISNIRFLKHLTGLTSIDLFDNKISDISILENLMALTSLDLSCNQINNIQALIPLMQKGLSVNLEGYRMGSISLYKNPIKEPPLEIIKQGRQSVLDWFEAKRKKLNEIKIILIGDPKAGKTSLLKRLKYNTFNENEPQTDGVNIEDIKFVEYQEFKKQESLHSLTGHFWDFGGQEIMNATHQFFLTKRAVYILVLDARKDANNSSQVRQWVKRIKATGDNSPIIVLANQIDINPGFGFENERELQNEFPQIKYFLKMSCNTNENIEVLRDKLAEIIPTAELFNTEIDERWIIIKEVLEKRTKAKYFLDEKQFVTICNKAGLKEKEKQKNAINFLHDLGLVLHFEDLNLSEYYVLDPYWITYGVYQILTSAYAGKMKGKVIMNQLNFIVNEEEDKKEIYNPANYKKIEYSSNERRFLIDILNQFKLCFCMADHSQFIIPDLLDTKEPSEVTEPIRLSKENIQFMYDYEYLPKFIMPNIMVEMNRMITDMWRTGCVLKNDGCRALINNYQNRISIVVTGEHKKKREFMSVIRFVINSINEKLSDKPVALIPLPGIIAFAEYERLLARERKGKITYIHDEDKPTEKEFLISELLDGISDYDEMRKMAVEILSILKNTQRYILKIEAKLDSHYEYLINLPNNSKIKDDIYEAMQELNTQQTAEIANEIMDWVTKVFVEFDGEMDGKLKDIYSDLKKTDDVQAKLKLSIPFINMLGINFETEFDVKSWAKKMYEKHKLEIFNLLC